MIKDYTLILSEKVEMEGWKFVDTPSSSENGIFSFTVDTGKNILHGAFKGSYFGDTISVEDSVERMIKRLKDIDV